MKVSEKYLFNLLRIVVAARAGNHCEFPGCNKTNCSPHHAGGRGNAVLYDPDTCIYLCDGPDGHHVSGPISAHGSPLTFQDVITNGKVRPYNWFTEARRKAQKFVKGTDELRNEWKEKLLKEVEY